MTDMIKNTRLIITLSFIICADLSVNAVQADDSKLNIPQNELSAKKIDHAWNITWSRFYLKETHLFYDFITSYEEGKSLDHLPTTAEVKKQFPNNCGYGTGMEDCMISAGVMMSMIVDRYAVTKEEFLRKKAYEVFQGIQLSATAYDNKGFLARGVCHEDLKSIYISTSRDQYTHAVHGLWHYARSPLCSEKTKKEIGVILTQIADRMIRTVVAKNDYDSLRADGTRDTRGISRMWNVKGHEAARLPMIYAAAWEVTGNSAYRELWRKHIVEAVKQSFTVETWQPTYALLQMQISLDLLAEIEPEPELKQQMHQVMKEMASRCSSRATSANKRAKVLDLTRVCTDWRTGEGISSKGSYRTIWYCIRESGEAAMSQMVGDIPFPEEQQKILLSSINRLNYDKVSSNGILFLQAAYWKSRVINQKQNK